MSSVLNIISMHRSQALREQLAEERDGGLSVYQCADVVQEICDNMHGDEFSDWLETTPDKNIDFNNAACEKLLQMKTGMNSEQRFAHYFDLGKIKAIPF